MLSCGKQKLSSGGVKDILKANRIEITRSYHVNFPGLFGSVVRNEAGEAGDVDILVDFDEVPGLLRFYRTRELHKRPPWNESRSSHEKCLKTPSRLSLRSYDRAPRCSLISCSRACCTIHWSICLNGLSLSAARITCSASSNDILFLLAIFSPFDKWFGHLILENDGRLSQNGLNCFGNLQKIVGIAQP
ncbi:MAG: nucleotidyltransferase domain-containing protein [Actinobacteria bacterium]|nr:nucleotidyltransferase domain-containing protein [Actinomycetota bacterium]